MKKFLLTYEEWILAVIGLVFVALIIYFTFWTISEVSSAVSGALALPSGATAGIDFKISELQGLTLRGINFGQ